MADKKNKKITDKEFKSLLELKQIDTYNTKLNILKNSNKDIDALENRINKIFKNDIEDDERNNNIFTHILDLSKTSISSEIRPRMRGTANPVTDSGIRSIFDMRGDNEETNLIENLGHRIVNTFVQMDEYAQIATLIPELENIINIITGDVLNINEVNKQFIINVFTNKMKLKGIESLGNEDKENIIKEMNDLIENEIIKVNDLETKIKNWIKEAFTVGAKPVMVASYKDLLRQVFKEFSYDSNTIESFETFSQCMEDFLSEENLRSPKLSERAKNIALLAYSQENYNPDYTTESMPEEQKMFLYKKIAGFYDKIIESSVEEYTKIDLEQMKKSKLKEILSQEAKKSEEIEAELKEEREKLNSTDFYKELKEKNKNMFLEVVNALDQKIEIINPIKSQLAVAKSTIQANISYMKYKDTFSNGATVDDGSKLREKEIDYSHPYKDPVNQIDDGKIGRDLIDKKQSNSTTFNEKIDDLIKQCDDSIAIELEPNKVIPIHNNGNALWYYVIEEDKYNEFSDSKTKKSFSFSEIFASVGVNNDNAVTYGNTLPSIMGGGMGGGSLILQNIGGMMVNGNLDGGDALRKNELMKELIYKTIVAKLDDPSVIDNKAFKDSIISLIRDGYIIDKKVKITCVPAASMIYFGHDIDNDGIPHALFKNSLLYCYLYLSSVISSAIIKGARASTRDVVKINMPLSKRIGSTIREIEHQFGVKKVWNASSFNSVSTILKQLGDSQTVYIPIFGNEELYQYENMETKNNLDIDDQFTDRLLEKITSNKVPNSMINKMNEDDFAKTIVSQHIVYRNKLIDYQKAFSNQIRKLLYLLIKNTKFSNEKLDKLIHDNLDKMEFQLVMPKRLNIINTNDMNGEIEAYVNVLVTAIWGDGASEEKNKVKIANFKKEMYRALLPVDFDEIDEIIASIESTEEEDIYEDQGDNVINDKRNEKLQEIVGSAPDDSGMDSYSSDDSSSDDSEEGEEEGGEENMFDF